MMRSFFSDMVWKIAFRMRSRTFAFPRRNSLFSYVAAGLRAVGGRSARLEGKIERLTHDVLFLKRHIGTYLGDGIALTFLADESPILVNSNDYGGPINLLDGGLYEEDNLQVLLSFLKPDDIVLDIGANLGFFTLKFAQRLRQSGRVLAFEPHPFLHELMKRSVYFNGLSGRVTTYPFGLSDSEGAATFCYPVGHLGGGYVASGTQPGDSAVQSETRLLDNVLPPGTAVSIVKIDVEGHELPVLYGMRRLISESPSIGTRPVRAALRRCGEVDDIGVCLVIRLCHRFPRWK